ncbi:MAG: trehalose-6-phosphate synthase, partial [Acidobacteria bacterium]|nr:trehalose-6-phosphate synthase [Acidobacteriota bacterium]
MGRLVVVSNRLPFTLRQDGGAWRAESSSGGLATAMDPILRQSGGVWAGWSGENEPVDAAERDRAIAAACHGYCCRPVDIAPDAARAFYEGFPNAVVWPVFHFI